MVSPFNTKRLTICLLVLLAALTASPVKAQHIHAYVNSGTVTSQVEGDELKGFNHWGYTGGVGAIANLTENGRWALSLETDYSCRGIYNRKFSSENFYNIKMNLHYVDIPLTVFFRDPYGGLQVGVGLVYGRLVSQPNGTIAYNANYFMPDTTDMSFLKNDLSPAIEFRFNIWRNLQLSARYQFSVIPVKKDWTFNYVSEHQSWQRDCYNQSLSIRLLWQFGDDESYHRRRSHR